MWSCALATTGAELLRRHGAIPLALALALGSIASCIRPDSSAPAPESDPLVIRTRRPRDDSRPATPTSPASTPVSAGAQPLPPLPANSPPMDVGLVVDSESATVGGGAANEPWMRIREKLLNVRSLPPKSEHAAVGTARLAWRGIGHDPY